MANAHEVTRRRLIDAGLGDYADRLLAHGRPSVRLGHPPATVAPPRRFKTPVPVRGLERGSSQLGGAPGGERLVAGPVAGFGSDVVWAGVWAGHTIRVVKGDGTAWTVGGATSGRLVEVHIPAPGLRPGGWDGSLGVCADGTVLVWHDGREPPERHPLLRDVVAVCDRSVEALALRRDGSVVTWRTSAPGGPLTGRPAVVIEGGVAAIAAGIGSAFALKGDGSVWAWGSNYAGKLGTGTDDYLAAPARVTDLERVVAVDCGVALRSDGSVWTWGGELPLGDDAYADAGLRPGGSRLGGRPDLPAGARWPTHDGRPLDFVGPIDLGDVAPVDETRILPPSGLLTFFYGLTQDSATGVVAAVVFSTEGTALARLDFPDVQGMENRMRAIPLHAEPDITVAPEEALPEPECWEASVAWECYGFEAGVLARHRMLGYPDLVQPEPQIGRNILLFQVDMYDLPEGSGLLYFVIAPEDLRARRFDRVTCDYHCD